MPHRIQNTSGQASPGATLFVVSIVQFVIPFMMSGISVALPDIGKSLNATAVQLGLIQTAQVLAVLIVLLPIGRFADIHGRKRVYIAGLVVLCVSTLILALARSIEIFLVLRFIQGIGGAMILSTSLAILTAVFPAGQRGRAMGVTVAMVYIGMAVGPSLSGFIVTYLGWRWVFLMVFFMGLAALLLTLTRLKGEWTGAAGEPFDRLGAGVFMVSLFVMIYGITELTEFHAARWIALAGLSGMGIFLRIEWKAAYPLLDLRLLKENPAFTFSNLATFLNYASATSFLFLFSLYLQYAKGLTPKDAGLVLVIQPAIQALLAPITGRLSDAYPPSRIATIGMGLCTAGLFIAATITEATSFGVIVTVMILLGLSLGLFSTANMAAIMGSVSPQHLGTASSMVSTMRSTGMLFSTTAIALILSVYLGDQPLTHETLGAFMASMRTALLLSGGLSLLGTIFSMAKGRLAESLTPIHKRKT